MAHSAEDPFFFKDQRGHYHAVTHNQATGNICGKTSLGSVRRAAHRLEQSASRCLSNYVSFLSWINRGNCRGQTCGAHLFSRDSQTWSISLTPVYTHEVTMHDGSTQELQTRQRPQLIFDPATGQPTTLFNGASFEGGNGDLHDFTHTLAFRFRVKTDDSV